MTTPENPNNPENVDALGNPLPYPQASPYSPGQPDPAAAYPQAPQPPQAPYGAPQQVPYGAPQQMMYQAPPATDGLAIAALVTGVLGLAIVPVVLGLMSLNKIKTTGAGGRGLAIAGVILGGLQIAFFVILIIFAVVVGVGTASNIDSYGVAQTLSTFSQV